jgi:hypothetical protein
MVILPNNAVLEHLRIQTLMQDITISLMLSRSFKYLPFQMHIQIYVRE